MALSSGASASNNRVVALVDMDCFYVQVEQRRNPDLLGKPCVVVQYKKWKGGGIIAVGYEARKFGVTRQMRGDDAKARCPDVNLIYVPENRGKADLTNYREAGAEVIQVLSTFSNCLERASVDEAYIDLTESVKRYRSNYTLEEIALKLLRTSHIINVSKPCDPSENVDAIKKLEAFKLLTRKLVCELNMNLAIGAIIADEMRQAVLEKTRFTCSAGVAHNKMLAKMIGGLNKPKQQTLLFPEDVTEFFKDVKIKKIRHLGGKFGEELQRIFNITLMSEIALIGLTQLKEQFGSKTGEWVYGLGQGVDNEPVRPRQLPKSVGCCKNFRGREQLATIKDVSYWLRQLASEVCERLDQEVEKNNRTPTHIGVSMTNLTGTAVSRSFKVSRIDIDRITADAFKTVKVFNKSTDGNKWEPAVILLGLSAGKFVEITNSCSKSIKSFLVENPPSYPSQSSTSNQVLKSSSIAKETVEKHDNGQSSTKSPAHFKAFFNNLPKNKLVSTWTSTQNEVKDSRGSHQASDNTENITNPNRQVQESGVKDSGDSAKSACNVVCADDFVICDKCGKRVLVWELPEHNDFHFAQQIQHDMNKGTRLEPKLRTSPPKKKQKCNANSIEHFFKSK